jgi:uncharacterized membrane protein
VELLRALLYGVSAQRPSHSLFLNGEQLPLEARMGGIFLGFLCAAAYLALLGRLRASYPPGGLIGIACWVLIALTGLDGLNAFLFDGRLPHLYPPSTAARLLTGLGAGLGLGFLALPVVASVVWRRSVDAPALEDIIELAVALAATALIGVLLLFGLPPLLWPTALSMLLSVLIAFGAANLYLIVQATGRSRRASQPADAVGLAVSSVGLALLELAGLSALRSWLVTSYGFTWGI